LKLETCQAVSLLLEGRSFDIIADIFECTPQTVRNRWKKFEEKVVEVGLMDAAMECDVVNEINKLRKLSSSIPGDISLDECLTGKNVASLLVTLGLSLESIDSFLLDLIKKADKENISGEEMGRLVHCFHNVSVNSGLGYSKLVEEMIRLQEEKSDSESELEKVKQQIETSSKDLADRLNDANMTIEKLDEYISNKIVLEGEGLSINDVIRTSKLLKELKSHDYDSIKIISLIDKHDSITETIDALEYKRKTLQKGNDELEIKNSQLNARVKNTEIKKDELEEDVLRLVERKKELFNETTKIINDFNSQLKSITSNFDNDLNNPESGIKARVLNTLNQTIKQADIQLVKFETESIEKMNAINEKTENTQNRITVLEKNLERYSIELRNYKSLENLAHLFLGHEVSRGKKLRIIVSTLELLENALNYEGLKKEAYNLEQVKMNVFRNS
jgi:hypothetical protein